LPIVWEEHAAANIAADKIHLNARIGNHDNKHAAVRKALLQ